MSWGNLSHLPTRGSDKVQSVAIKFKFDKYGNQDGQSFLKVL
jgi:hypothetical protein